MTVLFPPPLFFSTVISADPPFPPPFPMSLANGDRVAAFFTQRFFSPGQGKARWERKDELFLLEGEPFRLADRDESKKEDRGFAGLAARHRDLRGIPLGYWLGEDEETRCDFD